MILEAEGKWHYVGFNLNIHNLRKGERIQWHGQMDWPLKLEQEQTHPELLFESYNWYGEGDDMIFIDGEEWPPCLHGTGSEDYFNTANCPAVKYDAPYQGMTMPGRENWAGKISVYRFHIEDPIHFQNSIRVAIENGHANRRSDDYSSTAYWYQLEPYK